MELLVVVNRPFPSYFEPHYESEAKCKVFVMKISCHLYANKTNFHMKSFALSLVFIVRLSATRKWPINAASAFVGTLNSSKHFMNVKRKAFL